MSENRQGGIFLTHTVHITMCHEYGVLLAGEMVRACDVCVCAWISCGSLLQHKVLGWEFDFTRHYRVNRSELFHLRASYRLHLRYITPRRSILLHVTPYCHFLTSTEKIWFEIGIRGTK